MTACDPGDDKAPKHLALKAPSPWVERFAERVPMAGLVLDLACGGGRHTRLFLDLGHRVLAVDRDLSGIADLAGRRGLESAYALASTTPPRRSRALGSRPRTPATAASRAARSRLT